MLRGSAHAVARAFWFSIGAAPSEASDNFTRDRPARPKKFYRFTTCSPESRKLPITPSSPRRIRPGGLAACAFPEKKLPRRKRETLLSRLLFCVRKRFGGNLLWRSQFHSTQLAYATLFHRYAVQYVGLGNGAFVVRDDDKLTLFYEPVQHADKAVDVAFVHCRIHFVENAERTRSYHVNREQQRYSDHGALASA